MQLAETKITVQRTSAEDAQQRQVIVKIDGKDVGELMYGQTLTVPVTAGHHKLKVDNTWNTKTVELDVSIVTIERGTRFVMRGRK